MISQGQQISRGSTPAGNGRNRSASISTAGALTPNSSQGDSSRAQSGQPDSQHCDYPLPSIECGIECPAMDSASVAVSASPAHGRFTPSYNFTELQAAERASGFLDREDSFAPVRGSSTPSLSHRFAGLQVEEHASNLPDRGASPSAGPQPGRGSSHRSRPRSSSHSPVQRHELDDEELPASKLYNRDFQDALTQSKDLARRLADALSSRNLHTDESSAISGLYNQAREASSYCGPRNWKIGFVGDSGAGKSSLINSLLDCRNFAWTSGSGAACTCTATEYHYHDSPRYTIEVVYLPKIRLLEQFGEYLKAYRHFHLHGSGDPDQNLYFREAASVAWDTFKAAFQNQAILTKDFLLQSDEQAVWDSISSWIQESTTTEYPQTGTAPNTYTESAPDLESCSNLLKRLTSHTSEANAAARWPYIERVNVFLRANILSRGLILVDLPGLHDTSSARRMITERYIVNCDEVFAIASISRATTDAGVKAVIDLAKRTQRKHVGIICTKSDDINPEEAERDWAGPIHIALRGLSKCISDTNDELAITNDDLWNDGVPLETALSSRLIAKQRSKQVELGNYKYQRQRLLVTTRNRKVTNELRRIYADVIQDVFCVSNASYWEFRNKERNVALPWLQLSGIIALRRHCLGLVAKHQLRDVSAFMDHVIPNLVSSISLWVQSGSGHITAETRTRVRAASMDVERLLRGELANRLAPGNRILSALDYHFCQLIRSQFTENNNIWMGTAREAAYSWKSLHHPSYGAFCRKYGDHTVRGESPRCWNEEIIRGMIRSLTPPWAEFLTSVTNFFRQRSNTIQSLFGQGISLLNEAIDIEILDRDNFDTVQTLIMTIEHRNFLLHTEISTIVNEYETELARLGNAGFLSVIRTSFIGQHMEIAYQNAARDSGAGVTQRRQELIEGQVEDPNTFLGMQAKLELQFKALTRSVEEKIWGANRKHFLATLSALDTLRNENAVLEAEHDPDFRERMREETVNAQFPLRDIAAAVRAAQGENNPA